MRAVFRADAGDVIGHGHVMRCLTLADELRRREIECLFVCRDHSGHLAKRIQQRGFALQLLPSQGSMQAVSTDYDSWVGASQEEDAQQTLAAIDETSDYLVVDHYGLDQTWQCEVRQACRRLLVIDDLANRRHDADLLLDSGLGKTPDAYRHLLPASARALCGPSFALLARTFAELRSVTLNWRKQRSVNSILVFLGGGHSAKHIPKLIPELADFVSMHGLQVEIILGTQDPDLARSVFEALEKAVITARVSSLVDNMPDKLAAADLAIGAAGGSAYERACLGLPSVILQLAQNQSAQLEALARNKAAIVIEKPSSLSQALDELLARRLEIQARSSELCDGLGAARVADTLLEADAPEHQPNRQACTT